VSNPSEKGTGGRAPKAPRGMGSGKGAVLPSQKICISYIEKFDMVSLYAFPVILIDTVTKVRNYR